MQRFRVVCSKVNNEFLFLDSKDMLSGAIQNKDKMRDFQRRGKFQENGMNTVFSI